MILGNHPFLHGILRFHLRMLLIGNFGDRRLQILIICICFSGLYPRSWTRYDIPEFNVTVICRQITPIIPNDYKDSSLPTTVFVFEVINNSDEAIDATITFTWRSGTGKRRFNDEGECHTSEFHSNQGFKCFKFIYF